MAVWSTLRSNSRVINSIKSITFLRCQQGNSQLVPPRSMSGGHLRSNSRVINAIKNITFLRCQQGNSQLVPLRLMSGGHGDHMNITPSRWQWHKFKDLFHYYFMVGIIPVLLIVFGANVFIGPATLTEIPDDYTPKYWEYDRNPVTRFLHRYILANPQQSYEKFLHLVYEEDEKAKIRALEKKIRQKMHDRNDYQGWYTRPFDTNAKYIRVSREAAEYLESIRGDN